jgi:hypothetical protein
LNVPQPKTEIVRSVDEFAADRPFPFLAAYSLTPQAIHRLRAWHHAA